MQSVWQDMMVTGIPVVEKVARTIAVYAFLVAGLRVFGKRELGQLNPLDFIVLLLLSNTVQNAIIGNDNSLTGGLIGAFALLGMNYVVVRFLFRHRRLDQIFEGKPTVLIEGGRIRRAALAQLIGAKYKFTRAETPNLRAALRLDDAAVAKEVEANGFRLVSSQPFLPGSQYMAVFEKK